MEDVTRTHLFEPPDAHLARLDAELAAMTETLSWQNAQLAETAAMLRETNREVEAIGAEASRRFEETMRAFEALIARLEGRVRPRLTRRDFMLGGTALLCCGCATAPITGRRQFMAISPEEEVTLGLQAYREVLRKEPITHDPKATAPLRRIVARVAPVAERAAGRSDFQWEVNAINDDQTVNAFVLPGGKIGVYTGIFPVAETEAGMAIILGHEMGHAIARHAGERLSQQLGAQLIGTMLAAGTQGSAYSEMIMAAFGVGTQVGVLLPYSRLQEEEADRIGLVLGAQAGYDPQVAVGVWERMAKLPRQRPPEFLSTHPAPEGRIETIKQQLPQAMAAFRPHPEPGDTPLPSPQEIQGPTR